MRISAIDRKFRVPRVWSNQELRRFAHLFTGKIINVSGYRDEDKEEGRYRDYFSSAASYWISNYKKEACGFQGDLKNEFFLDLEGDLSSELIEAYDAIYNHTVLEHVFQAQKAFLNLCRMSRDVVIIVVPFLQQQHADYGDYWRFTPSCVKRLFELAGMQLIYLNANDAESDSIYIFAIGAKQPEKWAQIAEAAGNLAGRIEQIKIGEKIIGGKKWMLQRRPSPPCSSSSMPAGGRAG